jgi:hypothetical protein
MSQPQTEITRELALKRALESWNERVGAKWAYNAEWDSSAFTNYIALESAIFDGDLLGKTPGPFKMLAAFFLLYQLEPPYVLKQSNGASATLEQTVTWMPRIAAWSYPYNYDVLYFNGSKLPFCPSFPTAHFFVDFIGYLRSLRKTYTINPSACISKNLLVERITTVALILEGATYSSLVALDTLRPFTELVSTCIEQFTEEQRWDLYLNDPYADPW